MRLHGRALTLAATWALSCAEALLPSSALAVGLSVGAGALHLPNSNYHQLSVDTQLSFSLAQDTALIFQLGLTPPFSAHGFSQNVGYASLSAGWASARSGARLYAALGLGAYAEFIDGKGAPLVSIALNGGVRVGPESLGLQLGIMTYMGITSISNFLGSSSVAWPLSQFHAGAYVAL
jgi:hypothetical protein